MQFRSWCSAVLLAIGALGSGVSHAASMCVFDPAGNAGPMPSLMQDYALAMQRQGASLTFKVYQDEARAHDDFRAGLCDGILATGLRLRQYNRATGAIDSLGGTTIIRNGQLDIDASYEVMRKLLQTYSADSPQVYNLMVQGKYEVGGIMPVGAAYLITRDRRITTVEALAGKRVIALPHDPAQSMMIRRIKAVPTPMEVSQIVPFFRDNKVDVIALPALAFGPFQVDSALGVSGAVVRFPLMLLSYQVIIDPSKFPEGFGPRSRTWFMSQYDRMLQLIRRSEALDIPARAWMTLPDDAIYRYTLMLQEARLDIARQGIYDKRGLRILKKVRCHVNPADNECKTRQEEDWN
ncbi:hypothetical protein EYS42_14870 [Aquabacterium lacunae]|uniref:RND transporter n=1 Tax=Aquabacterium lacunae TaxID=2528630 RepID=A0A4Q9GZ75_9BURK|nr:putative solute-binding protein [Aquabacterium lacunae]TBO28286.1 hypothetical protein EYS42_14870 [Aquabacterium lacunae]